MNVVWKTWVGGEAGIDILSMLVRANADPNTFTVVLSALRGEAHAFEEGSDVPVCGTFPNGLHKVSVKLLSKYQLEASIAADRQCPTCVGFVSGHPCRYVSEERPNYGAGMDGAIERRYT